MKGRGRSERKAAFRGGYGEGSALVRRNEGRQATTNLSAGAGAAGAEAGHAVALEQQPHDGEVEHCGLAAARRCGDGDGLGG